jgi:hypothetical protein
MASLWMPPQARAREPKVSREHQAGTRQWEARVKSMMHMAGPVIEHWNRELALIDPNLRLWRAADTALAPGVVAGYYHLVRLNEAAPLWVMPLTLPDGSFAEPSDAMLRALRAADLQNTRVVDDRRLASERAARSAEHAEAHDDEVRVDETVQRFKAVDRTQVSMSTDTPWAQNFNGSRRPTRGKGG